MFIMQIVMTVTTAGGEMIAANFHLQKVSHNLEYFGHENKHQLEKVQVWNIPVWLGQFEIFRDD